MEVTPKFTLFGIEWLKFDLTIIIATTFAALVVFLFSVWATRKLSMRPAGIQNAMEMVVDFVRGINDIAYGPGKTAERYVAFSFTLFMFIFVANELGVLLMVTATANQPIPWLGLTEEVLQASHGISLFKSPTADLSVTLAMAIAIALYSNYVGIRSNFKGWLGHFFTPLGPIHLIEEFSKPLTHGMRLWANLFAGEVLITIMITMGSPLVTGLPLLAWIGFSLFIGVIQAYIFTVLANVYIGQKATAH